MEPNIKKSAEIVRQEAAKAFPHLKEGEDLFHVAITLGSGLGGLQTQMHPRWSLPFKQVGFPEVTVAGHAGEVVFGELEGLRVVFFAGRVHSYEGLSWKQITYYVQLLAELKVKILILSNAAGGIPTKDAFGPGTIMIMQDHLRLGARTDPCFTLKHQETSIPRDNFAVKVPNKETFYDDDLIALAKAVAKEQNLIHENAQKTAATDAVSVRVLSGSYAWWSGPSYETPSEIIFSHQSSANAVGMSTVPECLLARQFGISVLGFSLMTNFAAGFQSSLNHEEVKKCADEVTPTFKKYMCALLNAIGKNLNNLEKNRNILEKNQKTEILGRISEQKCFEELNIEVEKAAKMVKNSLFADKAPAKQAFIIPKGKLPENLRKQNFEGKIQILEEFLPELKIFTAIIDGRESIVLELPELYLKFGFPAKESTVLALFFKYLEISSVFVQILDVISLQNSDKTPRIAGDLLNFHDELKPWQFLTQLKSGRVSKKIVPSCEKSAKNLLVCFNGVSNPTKAEKAFVSDVFGAKMCCLFNPSIFYNLSLLSMCAVPLCSFGESKEIEEEKLFEIVGEHCKKPCFTASEKKATEAKIEKISFENKELTVPLLRKNFKLEQIEEAKKFLAEKLKLKDFKLVIVDVDLKVAAEKLNQKLEIELDCSEIPFFEEFCFKGRKQARKLLKFVDGTLFLTSSQTEFFDSCFTTDFSFFVRVLQTLRAKQIIILSKFISKAKEVQNSNLSVIVDHINLTGDNPLIGPHLSTLGPRFNDMSKGYSEDFVKFVLEKDSKIKSSVLLVKGDFKEFEFPFLETVQENVVDEKKYWKTDRKLVFSSVGAYEAITAGNYTEFDETGKKPLTKMGHLGVDVKSITEEPNEKTKEEILEIIKKFIEN